MKKIYCSIIGIALLFASMDLNAQCGGGRFHNFVFPTHTLTSNITYGNNLNSAGANVVLRMDIYQPSGDVSTSRPLVIIAHGGSFVGGSKTGTDVAPLAKDLAKLGYVAASIDYRLGMTNFPFGSPDSTDAGAAVMRAVHDARAAIRFFKTNYSTGGNTYKIDTNNIYFAGVSAGGFMALHVAYMDLLSEFPSYVDTVGQYGLGGGLEGLSGNPGYNSNVKGIINYCGALGDTTWMQTGDEPLLSFHGTDDNTVPFGTDIIYLLGSYPLLEVDGSSSVAMRANNLGIPNCFEIYEGQDHVPEVGTSANAVAHYDTTLSITRNWLEHYVCGTPMNCMYAGTVVAGVDEHSQIEANIQVFPNPANTSATLDLSILNGQDLRIEMYDAIGKKVKELNNVKADKYTISREQLTDGIYYINIITEGQVFSKKIMFN